MRDRRQIFLGTLTCDMAIFLFRTPYLEAQYLRLLHLKNHFKDDTNKITERSSIEPLNDN